MCYTIIPYVITPRAAAGAIVNCSFVRWPYLLLENVEFDVGWYCLIACPLGARSPGEAERFRDADR